MTVCIRSQSNATHVLARGAALDCGEAVSNQEQTTVAMERQQEGAVQHKCGLLTYLPTHHSVLESSLIVTLLLALVESRTSSVLMLKPYSLENLKVSAEPTSLQGAMKHQTAPSVTLTMPDKAPRQLSGHLYASAVDGEALPLLRPHPPSGGKGPLDSSDGTYNRMKICWDKAMQRHLGVSDGQSF